jgi:malonate-semialdehyde dehydrogenase (acetylating)/methylmalonate-semialdehyde dehydrogenase
MALIRIRRFSTSASRNTLGAAAKAYADRLSEWRGTSVAGGTTKNFIGGEFVESKTTDWIDVLDPVCCPEPEHPSGH